MARRSIDILFPAGGQNQRLAFQRQPPFTSHLASNVRAVDAVASRVRGGSRMGTLKSFAKLFGVGNPVTFLSQVRDLATPGDAQFTENFLTDAALRWDAAAWKVAGAKWRSGGFGFNPARLSSDDQFFDRGSVLKEIEDIDTSEDYTITVTFANISPLTFEWGEFEVFARMDNTTPNVETDGIAVKFSQFNANNKDLTMTFYAAGVPTVHTVRFADSSSGGDLEITIQADDTIVVKWAGTERLSETYATTAGTRIGLGFIALSQTQLFDAYMEANAVRVSYVPLGGEQLSRNRVVAAALNTADDTDVYRESNVKTMVAITSSAVAQTVRKTIVSAERLGKLYIPNPADAAPFVYDPSGDSIVALTVSVPGKAAPTKTSLAATFRDRVVYAGDEDNPTIWYMSRQGDPLDFDYSETDVQAAVQATTGGLYAGAAAGPIVALVALAIDYLLIAERNQMGVLRGDPRQGGQIDRVSHEIGFVSSTGWCHLPGGAIAFLGQNGLYLLNPGPGQYPIALSEDVIPQDLKNIDPEVNAVLMAYDPIGRGIIISITPWDSIQGNHYWYNIRIGAFFPFVLPLAQEPLSMINYQSDSAVDAAVLFGCRDGYIRRFHPAAVNDDGTAIDSAVWIGPIGLGGDSYKEGQILDIDLVLGRNSGDAKCSIYAAETPEEAIALETPSFTETVSAGRSVLHPMVRGAAAFAVIEDDDSGSNWQMEGMRMRYETLGDWRPD